MKVTVKTVRNLGLARQRHPNGPLPFRPSNVAVGGRGVCTRCVPAISAHSLGMRFDGGARRRRPALVLDELTDAYQCGPTWGRRARAHQPFSWTSHLRHTPCLSHTLTALANVPHRPDASRQTAPIALI